MGHIACSSGRAGSRHDRQGFWLGFKRTHIVLAVTAVPLIAVAAYCLSWYELRVGRLRVTADGRVVGVVRASGSQDDQEIRCWSADLSQESVIDAQARIIEDIDISPSSDLLAVDCHTNGLRMIDLETGKILWTAKGDRNGTFHSMLSFVCDGEYVAVGKYDGNSKEDRVRVYRAAGGTLVGKIDEPDRISVHHSTQSQEDRFAYLNLSQELVVVSLAEGVVRETARIPDVDSFRFAPDGSIALRVGVEHRVLDADGTLSAPVDAASAGAANELTSTRPRPTVTVRTRRRGGQLVAINRETGRSHTRNLQTIRHADIVFILVVLSSALAVWAIFLLRDGVGPQRTWRWALDLAIVCLLLHAMWWASPRAFWENVGIFWALLIGCGVFLGTLSLRGTGSHPWIMLAGIFLFPLSLIVLLTLILRQFRWRLRSTEGAINAEESVAEPSRGREARQFSLRDLFLMTAAVAASLGLVRILIAWDSLFEFILLLAVVGVGVGLLIGFSRLGARFTWGLLAVSLFMVAFASVGKWIGGRSATELTFCIAVPIWLVMHLNLHGYVIRRIAPGVES